MKEDSENKVSKDMLVRAAYRRIQALVDRAERAREEMNYVFPLLQHWIAAYKDLSGEELPEEMLQRAGIAIPRPVPAPAPIPQAMVRLPSVPEAVFEVMRRADEPLYLDTIVERVFSKGYGPDVKKPKAQARKSLNRGVKRGIYERTGPNTFKVNPSIRNKRYQEL